MTTATITLGGRKFGGISQALTANQDNYILGHLRLSGCMDVLTGNDGKGERTPEKRSEDLLTAILLSGRAHFILAGILTEDGTVWSLESANKNSAMFGDLTDVDEKIAMRTAIVEFIVGFFSFGGPSSEISQKSSSPSARAPLTKSAAHGTSGTSRR
jgi:hypothetical protein